MCCSNSSASVEVYGTSPITEKETGSAGGCCELAGGAVTPTAAHSMSIAMRT
jgi:hypothetical protein